MVAIGFGFLLTIDTRLAIIAIAYFPIIALYSLVIITLAYLFLTLGDQQLFIQYLTVPVMFVLLILMYQFDIIKGGADAKALQELREALRQ